MSLRVEHLSKEYAQGEAKVAVLRDLSFSVAKGEIVAVVGESGSGKSTLLSLLAGLDSANEGQIIVGDTDLLQLNEKQVTAFRASNIGIVFQQYHLVDHLTSLENVMLPLEITKQSNIRSRAVAVLEELGLSHRLTHFPTQLSGGECQRVAIARAIVSEPKLLLADEPSGNLDTQTGEKVMSVLFDVVRKHQITTVLVTHSESLARKCQRELFLDQGQLREISRRER